MIFSFDTPSDFILYNYSINTHKGVVPTGFPMQSLITSGWQYSADVDGGIIGCLHHVFLYAFLKVIMMYCISVQ